MNSGPPETYIFDRRKTTYLEYHLQKLSVEELKNITGGAYVESGYIYYKLNGQNKRRQILALEDDVNYIVEKVMEAGASDEEIMEFFSHLCAPFGPEEDC